MFLGKLSHLEIDTEDTAAILMRMRRGLIAELHLDYVQRVYARTCDVVGDRGTIRWDYSEGEVRWYSASSREWRVFRNPGGWRPNQMHIDEMGHFLRCIDGQEQPTLNVREARSVLETALAAKRSSAVSEVVRLGVAA